MGQAAGAGPGVGSFNVGAIMRRWFSVPQHAYRVQLSGLSAKSVEHYRRVGGLVVLATGPDRAKLVGMSAFRLIHAGAPKSETRGVRVVGVVDLGHRGTDGEGCPICAGVAISPDLFTGRA
jgi:hypothetical protein